MSVINNLKWRYATKRMNGVQVPQEQVDTILEAMQLAPTSMGLQPFTILEVTDAETKAKISPAIYNQPQITEGSHVLIFATWTDYSAEKVDAFINNVAQTRGISPDSLAGFRQMVEGSLARQTPESYLAWAQRQAYIALGVGLVTAAELKIDSTPMEGFDPDALDAVLGLKEKGLRSTVILTLGYRDTDNDALASAAKVRRNIDELVVKL